MAESGSTKLVLRIISKILRIEEARLNGIQLELWDGTRWPSDLAHDQARLTITIKHPSALRRLLQADPSVAFAEAYIEGEIDLGGDLGLIFEVAQSADKTIGRLDKALLAVNLARLPKRPHQPAGRAELTGKEHSIERDRAAISSHYDVDSRFFELWLDHPSMVYSCAYFPSATASLEVAQQDKLDLICRKLRLREGEELLDIGCGWGGLVMHAAREYGVRALGITNSKRQFEYAKSRIQDENLSGTCDVQLCDYREIGGTYDKISSIGMFEHVGKLALGHYFSQIAQLLRPDGAFLNHGIAVGSTVPQQSKPMTGFGSRAFPDGELIPIADVIQTAIGSGLELRDVENLREHYALTLDHWLSRLEAKRDEALTIVDEATYRTWRLLFLASAEGFRRNTLAVYQSLFVRSFSRPSDLPLTRADWYPLVSTAGL